MDDKVRDGPVIDDCWNKIGVRGDGSCPLLKQHVHCRNCPVFSAAAAERLHGDLPTKCLNDATAHFAQAKAVEKRGAQSVVLFRIGAEWLALSTPLFKEVVELRSIHTLPHRRGGTVLGLLNVRGELLICVALDKILGLEPQTERKHDRRVVQPRLIVVSRGADRLVFPVDEVHGTQRFHTQELIQSPTTVSKANGAYTKAILPWQDKSVGVLDDELLFYALNRSLA